MGGAVSSGESNDELIDNLLDAAYIKSPLVERVFRAVDRSMYYTQAYKMNAYKDLAWKDGNLHLSAPCIYSEVMENIKLKPGMSFLNIGSGTGYLSTMCGLMIGKGGINHGIELYPDVVEYARNKLNEFFRESPAIDMFDFCPPEFVVGNCLDTIVSQHRYDRIYCGAACPEESIRTITYLLKIGGICVIPINDSLVQITRVSEDKEDRNSLLPVSFANLIPLKLGADRKLVKLPDWNPPSLQDICRSEIRTILRNTITPPEARRAAEGRKKRRKRQERRRASRLLVVQRRRSGGEHGETGFVAVAYSVGNNSSDEDDATRRPLEMDRRRMENQVDEEVQGQRLEESGDDDDNFELPDLDDDVMQTSGLASSENGHCSLRPAASISIPAASIGIPPVSLTQTVPAAVLAQINGGNAGSSSGNRGLENGHSNACGRSRGLRGLRAKNTRQDSATDGIFGRLREIYRRREQPSRSQMLGQFERSLQQFNLSSIYSSASRSIVQNLSEETAPAVVAPMEEENSVSDRSRSVDNNPVRDDSGDWSTDSSIDSCPFSSSNSTDDEPEPSHESQMQMNVMTGESGGATDTGKGESFSNQMKTKLKELPLPPSIKVYLNYNRQF